MYNQINILNINPLIIPLNININITFNVNVQNNFTTYQGYIIMKIGYLQVVPSQVMELLLQIQIHLVIKYN